ncbi:hypothetical protein J4405_05665 [Candidatus Woesearchaeota archaeon]|nr:hypothetical protein [Candidatus Woesearchaeota archaeon]
MRTWKKLMIATGIAATITTNLLLKESKKPRDLSLESKPPVTLIERHADWMGNPYPNVTVGVTVTDALLLATGIAYVTGCIKDYISWSKEIDAKTRE